MNDPIYGIDPLGLWTWGGVAEGAASQTALSSAGGRKEAQLLLIKASPMTRTVICPIIFIDKSPNYYELF
jgi:hypothetical protein